MLQKLQSMLKLVRQYDKHLLIYNKEIVSPYKLVTYGYQQHPTNNNQIYCKQCSNYINFTTDDMYLFQDNLSILLKEHQQQCYNNLLPCILNYYILQQYGYYLYHEIILTYQNNLIHTIYINQSEVKSLIMNKSFINLFKYAEINEQMCNHTCNFKFNQQILSLLGWTIRFTTDQCNLQLYCYYCGANDLCSKYHNNQNYFAILSTHKQWCCIVTSQSVWSSILSVVVQHKLKQCTTGTEFSRNEAQKEASKTRAMLYQDSKKYKKQYKQLKNQINALKQEQIASQSNQSKIQEQLNNKLEKIENCLERMNIQISNTIKKIKLN